MPTGGNRIARIAYWLDLTRRALPEAARHHHWPIRLDHCFMRVCLDHAYGARWDGVIARPAVLHMDSAALERAITAAERVLREPALLPEMNRASLRMRGRA